MTGLIMRCWHSLSSRAARERERRFMETARRAMGACACAASRKDEMSPTQRLEHLALFMQAGYLGMSWYIDVSDQRLDTSRE